MASIPIHQDIFNFERKRKGFSPRQLTSIVAAAALMGGMVALVGYGLGAPYTIALTIGLVVAAPAVVAGFVPIQGLPAEEFAERLLEHTQRGNALNWEGECIELEQGDLTRAYLKRKKGRGAECLH